MTTTRQTRHWGMAWGFLAVAIALHVADEALSGFLPLYNATVESLRESHAWVWLPTFDFRVWIAGLLIGVVALLGLSPLVFAGNRYLRPVSYVLGALMTANALGHFGASIYFEIVAPGARSSPILLLAALILLITMERVRRSAGDSRPAAGSIAAG